MTNESTIHDTVIEYLQSIPHQKRYDVKTICKAVGLNEEYYTTKRQCVYNLVREYQSNYGNEQGLKRLDIHSWRGFLYAPASLSHEMAIKAGWVPRNAKNRGVAIRVRFGRCEWFETGRVNIWVKKPYSDGRLLQVLADAFFKTNLFTDIKQFDAWVHNVKQNGIHVPIDMGQKMPYAKIIAFKESNGITIVVGDKSHPNSIEIQASLPRWAENSETALQTAMSTMASLISGFTKQSEMFMAQQKQVAEILGGSSVAKPVSEFKGIYQ